MLKLTRILVPVDFSPESDLALEWAIRLAQEETKSTIIVCYVRPRILAPVGPEAMFLDSSSYFAEEKKAIDQKLQTLQTRIPASIQSSTLVKEGPTAPALVEACHETSSDLVVLTTHGRRGLSHMLQGSVSEEVVRLGPCPVLVLHLHTMLSARRPSDAVV